MELREVVARFAGREPGTAAFKAFERDCTALIGGDPVNAALYYVLGTVARAYWQRYEDEPVTVATADDGKQLMLGYAGRVLDALERETDFKMSALNSIVLEYQHANAVF